VYPDATRDTVGGPTRYKLDSMKTLIMSEVTVVGKLSQSLVIGLQQCQTNATGSGPDPGTIPGA
jgi:hypothetical protein